jgi:hypothetical protein
MGVTNDLIKRTDSHLGGGIRLIKELKAQWREKRFV